MTKILIVATIFGIGLIAQAKTFYCEEKHQAVIYFMQDQNTVNVLYCGEVDRVTAQSIAKGVYSNAARSFDGRCVKESNSGVTVAALETKMVDSDGSVFQVARKFEFTASRMFSVLGRYGRSENIEDKTCAELEVEVDGFAQMVND